MAAKKVFIFIMVFILFQCNTASTARADYVNEGWRRYAIPDTYTFYKVYNNIGEAPEGEKRFLNDPQDLFIAPNGYIYIADSGNNRIVKLNKDGQCEAVFKGINTKPMKNPGGIFVDETSDMYIADTGNSRILHLSPEGEFVEEFTLPDSELIGTNTSFAVSKLVVNDVGYIYVIRGENIMTIDSYNRFRGYMGQSNIGFNLVETLVRMFGSEQQQNFVTKRFAAAYTNLTLDSDGMIFATSRDSRLGEIKRLNSVDINIYKKYKVTAGDGFTNPFIKAIRDFIKGETNLKPKFYFGERNDDNYNPIFPIFTDICVDAEGIVTVVENQTGKIYQYDQSGDLITVFGGKGEQRGSFKNPSAIDVDQDGNIYVLDRSGCNIQIFKPTDFVKLVHNASSAYDEGKYEEAYDIWSQVLEMDENYSLAHKGISNAFFKKGQWQDSMDASVRAQERGLYSKAFNELRYDRFREYFIQIVIALVLIIAAVFFGLSFMNKKALAVNDRFIDERSRKMKPLEGVLISLHGVFHPLDTFETIRYNKGRLNMLSPLIILVLVALTQVVYVFTVHFPLQRIALRNVNIIFEIVQILIIPVTWVVAAFAVTSIADGETKPGEIFFSAAICMLPFLFINFPMMFISKILGDTEKMMFNTITAVSYVWCFVLFFISLRELNDFSFGKTVAMMIVIIITIVLIWIISIMVYVLVGRLLQFVVGIYNEVRLTWF